MNILDKIVADKRIEVDLKKALIPIKQLEQAVLFERNTISLAHKLRQSQSGIIAEHNRIKTRFQNKKFRRFVNITQLMVFSNNMEYDDNDPEPVQGAYYASSSYQKPIFNYFREEEEFDLEKLLKDENDDLENVILKDNNLVTIKHNPEFATSKSPKTPTNRISTSLFSRERLKFILEYSLEYVNERSGLQKHIMR